MRPTFRSSGDGGVAGLCAGLLIAVSLLSLVIGCASSRRQRGYARLYRVVPGEEREDFGRLASWIAERDGQITLPIDGTIHWAETAYYRWYSNETFVIVTCPPQFHAARSEIRWLCGTITSPESAAVGRAIYGEYGRRGPGTFDYDGIAMRPWLAPCDGIFGVRFGERRSRLLQILEWHSSDQLEEYRSSARKLASYAEHDLVSIDRLRRHPGVQLSAFLSREREVGILKVRMPESPGLAGLDFMKEDPPVLRQGSFEVDVSLAAKGLRRQQPAAQP